MHVVQHHLSCASVGGWVWVGCSVLTGSSETLPLSPALQLTLSPAHQQLFQLQQAQAQLLAAAVHHSASQQSSATGASISASAATPITQMPLSQPIQITSVKEQDRHTYGTIHTAKCWGGGFWFFLFVVVLIVGPSAAATAAEPESAPVCPGADGTPHRHVTAAHSLHHLPGNAGPVQYVPGTQPF